MKNYLFSIGTFIWLLLLPELSKAQQGAIDPTFNPTDNGFGYGDGANGIVYTSAVQADGKIIVGGTFTDFNGTIKDNIARLNADGSNDLTFNSGNGTNGGAVWACAIQNDGKIIIGGDFTAYNGTARNRIARLNTDGTIDATFNPGTGANNDIQTISIQSDGKIIIGGQFTTFNGTAINRIARIDANGAIDPTFVIGAGSDNIVYSSAIQSDGKIIIAGSFTNVNGVARTRVARINTDGSTDLTFTTGSGANNSVGAIAIQSDGKILIGGAFTTYSATPSNYIARLNTNGTLDATFAIGTGANNGMGPIKIQSDGKIIITGDFTSFNGTAKNRIARLNTNGTVDLTYNLGSGAADAIYACALQTDDKAIIGGSFLSYNGSVRTRIARINTDGSVDATFGYSTGANGIIRTSYIQPNGKIAFGGDFRTYDASSKNCIARANADGSIDVNHNPGIGTNGSIVRTISMQSTGRLILGGDFIGYAGAASVRLARSLGNGNQDAVSFPVTTGANNIIYKTLVQLDDKIIIVGAFTAYAGTARNRIARVLNNAANDAIFNPGTGADGVINTCALQSDGNIIIGGDFLNYNGTPISRIARITTTGTLDATFNPGTGTDGAIYSCYVQSDGKIIIAGNFTTYNGTARNNIARLNADGTLDATFNPGAGANNIIYTTCGQVDGKVIIGGNFTSYDGTARNYLARLNADGTLDLTFNVGTGANNTIYTTAIQSDGYIIIGGAFTSYNGIGRNRIARIIGSCITPSVTSTTASARCGVGTLTLNATANTGVATLNWYSATSGGTSLGSGTSFTTPSISNNTTYYVEAGNMGCVSLTRTAVTASVNAIPTLTVNSGTICKGQSFTITPSGANTYTIQGGSSIKTPTSSISYTVIGTSAEGCVSASSATTSITVNATPTIAVNSGSICSGKSFTINPTGASTYTIQGGSAIVSPTTNTSYLVVGTSSLGCVSNTLNSTVTVSLTPTITVNSGAICTGKFFTMTPSGASTYTFEGGSAIKTPTATTSYTVIGKSAAGCIANTYATANVTVNTTPIISVNSGAICKGQSFTITPSGANTYTIQGGSSIKTPTSTISYTVVGTSTEGCTSATFATSSITVNATPTIAVNSGSICSGNSFTINPSGASTYTIQGGSNIVNPTANTTYSVVGTSTAGCVSNTLNSTVTVSLTPTITVNSGAICAGNSFTIIPSGASTYTFEGGSAVKTPTATTSYTVIGKSAAGCISTTFAISNITVNALPVISIPSTTICAGSTATLTASGANTYTWSTGANTSFITASPTLNTTYTINGTSLQGCNGNSVTATITVGSAPSISLNSVSVCAGSSATLTASGVTTYTWNTGANTNNIIVSPTVNTTYSVSGNLVGCSTSASNSSNVIVLNTPTISVNSGSICAGNSFTIIPSGANTYTLQGGNNIVNPTVNATYTVIGTHANGCVSSTFATSSVFINAAPSITVNSGAICLGKSFTITPSGAVSYTYAGGSSVVTPTTNATYNVNGIGANGCIGLGVTSVTVNALPTITVNSGTICSGNSFTIIPTGAVTYTFSSGSNVVSPNTTTTYTVMGTNAQNCTNNITSSLIVNATPTLNVAGGSICPGNSFTLNPTGANTYSYSSGQVVTPTVTTSYTISGTSAQGCLALPVVATVIYTTAVSVSISSPSTACFGSPISLTANGASSYTWSNGATTAAINPTLTSNTTYSVIGASGTCTNTAIQSITVNALPTISVNNATVCAGNSFTMAPSGAVSYTFSNGSNIATPTANTTYTVTGSDANGCNNFATSSVTVNALPTVIASTSNTLLCMGQTASLNAMGANTYVWNTSETSANIAVSPTATTVYTVTGVDVNGCTNIATVQQDVSLCTGINSNFDSLGQRINMYPNPNNGQFIIELKDNSSVVITDGLGKIIFKENMNQGKQALNLINESNGVYFVKVTSGNTQSTKRLVISK